MSRPHTLGEAAARILAGTNPSIAICEFADTFYASADREPMLADEPPLTGDRHLDALLGGIAEYLGKRCELAGIPAWCSDGCRFLGLAYDGFRWRWHAGVSNTRQPGGVCQPEHFHGSPAVAAGVAEQSFGAAEVIHSPSKHLLSDT